jgi:hypothetical protein
MKIKITAGQVEAFGELNDSKTAQEIAKALPIEASGSTWGEEIYFGIPVRAGLEAGASADVAVGDLAYWPPGHAFCIFFGPTPASYDKQPRAASEVNVVGRITGDAKAFLKVRNGAKVRIEKAE